MIGGNRMDARTISVHVHRCQCGRKFLPYHDERYRTPEMQKWQLLSVDSVNQDGLLAARHIITVNSDGEFMCPFCRKKQRFEI